MQLAQREPYVVEWAKDKGLIQHTTEQALAQHGKTDEEVGELLEAIERYESIVDPLVPQLDVTATVFTKDDLSRTRKAQSLQLANIRLEAGDVLVTLVIQCAIQKQSLGEVISAYDNTHVPDSLSLTYSSQQIGVTLRAQASALCYFFIGQLAEKVGKEIEPYDLTLDECLEAAWKKIKGRKGKTIGGVFVKESV